MGIKNYKLCSVLSGLGFGYYNPVPKLISVDFKEIESCVLNFIRKYQMKDFHIAENGECGWYIAVISSAGKDYLHKDLKIHNGTGYIKSGHLKHGKAPGYYPSRKIAETYLQTYLNLEEKQKMTDKIEIDVKVNGVETPLYRISEQTLLAVRENSKPKEVPVARTAESNGRRYLILKVPEYIKSYAGKIVVINLKGNYINGSWTLEREQAVPMDSDCVFSYKSVKTIE